MCTNILRRSLLIFPLFLSVGGTARAQDDPNAWARKMFDSTEHDFGAVARGAEVAHRFKVTNLYKQDIHIASVTTTCGCTAPQFNQTPVKSLGTTFVDISMDTNKFQREKSSTVTVTVVADGQPPMAATVQIPVKVYIRTDVVVTPSSANFGAVDQGSTQQRKIEIAYAGRPDWQIKDVVTNNKYLTGRVTETARANGQVNYDLILSLLPGAPVGILRQEITLVTDDENGQIPILAQAHVESDVTVTPTVVQLGNVAPGGEVTKTVLFRGHKPFVIEKVECKTARETFRMPQLSKEANTVHVLPLTLTASKQTGNFTEKFVVTIAGRPEPIVFTALGTIQ